MAYQAFYNKYRPQTFDEVVGQKAVVTTLKNAIMEDKIAHAYLFCGPRGTGKTSMARLFAKALNCDHGLGCQCNECQSCKAITAGEHPDVVEIDAASNSTVDSVRQLIENVSYQPIMSKYKIYIIDEVHNMSNSAFNALLKTLEEPPSFCVFILATTEPQKLLPTILSRVQRFDFSKVSESDLIRNMQRVLQGEGISYDDDALRLIASLSDGGVRDSLSLLDKTVSYCGSKLSATEVDEMLGLLSLDDEITILNLIQQKKIKECLSLVKKEYESGVDINRLHGDLIDVYKDFIIYQSTRDASLLDRLKEKEVRMLNLSFDDARRNIQTLIKAKRENRYTEDLLTHFELTLIELMSDPIQSEVRIVEKKEETKKPEEMKAIASPAVEIKAKEGEKGFFAPAEEEKPKEAVKEDKIGYTMDDLLALMSSATKEGRLKIGQVWSKLDDFATTNKAYEAKALYTSTPRIVTDDVIAVTNKSITEVEKINKKSVQKTLREMIYDITKTHYCILPLTVDEFNEALEKWKAERPEKKPYHIDFGVIEDQESADSFMDELLSD